MAAELKFEVGDHHVPERQHQASPRRRLTTAWST
jgi:hypothetical protein